MGEDRLSITLQVGQAWEFRDNGRTIDVYMITELNRNGTVQIVDLRSLERFKEVRVSHSSYPQYGWKVLT